MKYRYDAVLLNIPDRKTITIDLYISNFTLAKKKAELLQAQRIEKVILMRTPNTYPPRSSYFVECVWINAEQFANMIIMRKF